VGFYSLRIWQIFKYLIAKALCLYHEIGFRPAILYSNHTNNIRVQNKENAGTTIKTCPKEKK
jgi:hypothetical protein